MSVVAIGKYEFPAKDAREHFMAPLLFVGWEDHLMFCSPVALMLPENTVFGALCDAVLSDVFGSHPDFVNIDWSRVEWFKSGQPWRPDYLKTLAENGLGHKDVIRFRTPGLNGIGGSCN